MVNIPKKTKFSMDKSTIHGPFPIANRNKLPEGRFTSATSILAMLDLSSAQ
jgi:hypothetical protein